MKVKSEQVSYVMVPASETYGVFTMKKKQILTGCIVLVVILIIIVLYVLDKGEDSVKDELSNQHTTESDTGKEIEDETPLEVVKPENDKKTDTDSVDDDLAPNSQIGNTENGESSQGASQNTDKQETDTGEKDKEDGNKEEDESESKPIELPFIPVD